MFSKATLLTALTLVSGLACAAPSPGSHTGKAMLFLPSIGACGVTNTNADFVAGVSPEIFDQFGTGNPNNNPVCGLKIVVHTPDGKTATAQVEEKCAGCASGDILLSPAAFGELAPTSAGVIQSVNWSFFLK